MRQIQRFRLLLVGAQLDEQVLARLWSAGCDDAAFGHDGDAKIADFGRVSPTFEQAVLSAIRDIESAGVDLLVARVEPDDLVTASEIAERTGRSRQSIAQLVAGIRRTGDFPAPLTTGAGKRRVWRWTDVQEWFARTEAAPDSFDSSRAHFIAAANGALDLRNHSRRFTEGGGGQDVIDLVICLGAGSSTQSGTPHTRLSQPGQRATFAIREEQHRAHKQLIEIMRMRNSTHLTSRFGADVKAEIMAPNRAAGRGETWETCYKALTETVYRTRAHSLFLSTNVFDDVTSYLDRNDPPSAKSMLAATGAHARACESLLVGDLDTARNHTRDVALNALEIVDHVKQATEQSRFGLLQVVPARCHGASSERTKSTPKAWRRSSPESYLHSVLSSTPNSDSEQDLVAGVERVARLLCIADGEDGNSKAAFARFARRLHLYPPNIGPGLADETGLLMPLDMPEASWFTAYDFSRAWVHSASSSAEASSGIAVATQRSAVSLLLSTLLCASMTRLFVRRYIPGRLPSIEDAISRLEKELISL